MAQDYIWRGPRRLEQGATRWSFGEKITAEVSYNGPYDLCLQERPARGATVAGFTNLGMVVDTAEVDELDGGAGVLRLTLISPQADESNYSTAAIGEPQYELDFEEVTKKIESHPKCGNLTGSNGETITWDEWDKLLVDTDFYTPVVGGWSVNEYLQLKNAGVDEYPVAAPVVRRTTYHMARPADVGLDCFTRQDPPSAGFEAIDDYEWIKGTDRCTKQGRVYARVTEWKGADTWSTILYPE